jgi:hypothetical protein
MSLAEHVTTLSASLATWAQRDSTRPQPEVREAANVAMDSIDSMLRELYEVRATLVDEIGRSDRASMDRVEALLAESRTRREADFSAGSGLSGGTPR